MCVRAPVLLLCLLVVPSAAYAQIVTPSAATVSGVVLDAESGAPLRSAIVSIPSRSRAVLSADDGTFQLRSVPVGTHVFRVRQFGYRDLEQVVVVTEGGTLLELRLDPAPVAVEGVDVSVEGAMALGGRVIDGGTGRSLPGVYVWLPGEERGVLSDSVGGFGFDAVPTGPQLVQVEAAGYGRQYVPVVVRPPLEPLEIVMQPDSAVLAGLPVVEQELRGRRNAYLGNVFAMGSERLARVPADDARLAVQNFTLARVVPCTGPARSHWCVSVGGRPMESVVCIDGELAPGGLDDLQRYRPHELRLLEVWGTDGLTVRAYTHAFIEEMARDTYALLPAEPDARRAGTEGQGWATRGADGTRVESDGVLDRLTVRC